jgi:glycine/D-amino acid oxidase-like deaminating enzyme
MDLVYDLAIVGAGMFGSSCARWASEDVRSSILIGPSEMCKSSSNLFGAWFDEGRITEMADSTTVWRILGNLNFYLLMRADEFVSDLVKNKNKKHIICLQKVVVNLFTRGKVSPICVTYELY